MYFIQGIMKPKEAVDLTLKGISELMPLALLMLLAFAIGDACKELETGIYVANATKEWLSPELLPAVVFILVHLLHFLQELLGELLQL